MITAANRKVEISFYNRDDITLSEISNMVLTSIRNVDTIERDAENLKDFIDFIHNSTSKISYNTLTSIISNKNFTNMTKVGIVKKLIKCYSIIVDRGGIKEILKNYSKLITELKRKKYIKISKCR